MGPIAFLKGILVTNGAEILMFFRGVLRREYLPLVLVVFPSIPTVTPSKFVLTFGAKKWVSSPRRSGPMMDEMLLVLTLLMRESTQWSPVYPWLGIPLTSGLRGREIKNSLISIQNSWEIVSQKVGVKSIVSKDKRSHQPK